MTAIRVNVLACPSAMPSVIESGPSCIAPDLICHGHKDIQ
jgi:hypothetical protein